MSFAMPYTSTELQEYTKEYWAISEALAPVFEWLFAVVGLWSGFFLLSGAHNNIS
jgi:hypothetical protein